MKSVRIGKTELLKLVKENRDKHVKEYNEACADYLTIVKKTANALLAADTVQAVKSIKALPDPPVSYEASYNKAISMLQMGVDEIVEIDEGTFDQLILDNWHWKQSFTFSNSIYKSF